MTAQEFKPSGLVVLSNGRTFDVDRPDPTAVSVHCIANSLAIQNRYNGQTLYPYSIAQHSVLMSEQFEDPTLAWYALMHDAPEAFGIGDVIRPVKRRLGEVYERMECGIWEAICTRYAMNPYVPEAIKRLDDAITIDERRQLFSEPRWDVITVNTPGAGISIEEWSWRQARDRFLRQWDLVNHRLSATALEAQE